MSRRSRPALVAALLFLPGAELAAQGIVRLAPGAELGAQYRGSWHRVQGRQLRTGTDLVEWLQIPLEGQLLDPRLAQYRLALRPELRQSRFTGDRTTLHGRQLGFGYSADLLNALPVRLRLNGSRLAGSSSGGLGSETSMRHTTFGATVAFLNPVFPLQAGWSRQYSRTALQATPSSPAVRTAYALRALSVSGRSSKANVRYERLWFDDRLTGADYEAWTLGLLHNLRWGKGSGLESGYERSAQTGALDFDRRDWFEKVHLQHTRTASSDLSYRYTRSGPSEGATRINSVAYQFATRIVRGLSAGILASRSAARFTSGSEDALTVAPRLNLELGLPARLRLFGEGSTGRERRRRDIDGSVPITVVDEPHTVDATRGFFLEQLDADSATVQVRHAVRPLVYTPGTDFLVVPVGRERRIEVPPGSRIVAGDRVLVSYSYLAGGSARQTAWTASYRVGVMGRGVRLEHSRSLRQDGKDPRITSRGIVDFDETSTRLTIRSTLGRLALELNGSTASLERAEITRREYAAGLDLSYPAASNLTTAAGLHWNRNLADGMRATATAARVASSWYPSARLQFQGTLDVLLWQQSGMDDDRFLGGSLEASWQVFALEAQTRYEYSRRTGPYTLTGHRVLTRLVRRI